MKKRFILLAGLGIMLAAGMEVKDKGSTNRGVPDSSTAIIKEEKADLLQDAAIPGSTGAAMSEETNGTLNAKRADAGLPEPIFEKGEAKENIIASNTPSNEASLVKEEKADLLQATGTSGRTDADQSEETGETLNMSVTDTSQEAGCPQDGIEKEIFDATNAERAAAGLPELAWNDELAKTADLRAEEIITNFDHVRLDGTKCYVLSSLIHGENIARGPHVAGQEFVSWWMGSEGHRRNMLRDRYTLIGIGTRCTEYGDTAVQIFGYED